MTAKRFGVGIDFGTSNSTAAVFDGDELTLIALEADAAPGSSEAWPHGGEIMPSATYIDRDLHTRTGQDAINRYIADNTGRKVELVPEVIGKALLAVGPAAADSRDPGEVLTQDVHGDAMLDTGLQGRLFRGTKRLLGRDDVRRLMVFDQPFRLVALITPILLRMRAAVAAKTGAADTARAGHPVNFEGRDRHRNQLALTRLDEAYRHAGVRRARFYPEPVAAAVSFLETHPKAAGKHLLTVDFGGGTLDFCVLERGAGNRFRVVATHGIGLGGDHIDQRLFQELLFPLLGKGERWRRAGEYGPLETAFPFEDYEVLLASWPVTYLLNQNRYTAPVQDCIAEGGPARLKFLRLRELIQHNLGYLVFQAIKEFKARLSVADEAVLDVPEIDVAVRLSRAGFETLIGDMLERIERAVEHTLVLARLPADAIDVVLRTGGSSLIPAVYGILDGCFPGRVVNHDPFTSVAAGLAIAEFHDLPAGNATNQAPSRA